MLAQNIVDIISIPVTLVPLSVSSSHDVDIQILKITQNCNMSKELAWLPQPRAHRWILFERDVVHVDVKEAKELGASIGISCPGGEMDTVSEVLAAIAARPQSLLVGIDVADLLSMTQAAATVGEAVIFDGLSRDAPKAFLATFLSSPRRGGLLFQLTSSSEPQSGDWLEQLAITGLNCLGIESLLYTYKVSASKTRLVLMGF